MMSLGSSTTQIRAGSRRGSSHTLQSGPTARLKQTSHSPTVSLTSRIASARASASSLDSRRMWKASRWAVRWPTPGRRFSSVIRRLTGAENTGPTTLDGAPARTGPECADAHRTGDRSGPRRVAPADARLLRLLRGRAERRGADRHGARAARRAGPRGHAADRARRRRAGGRVRDDLLELVDA